MDKKHPWKERAEQIKSEMVRSSELDMQKNVLNEQILSLQTQISKKDEQLDHVNVKVDILEKRMESLRNQSMVVDTYEKEIETLKSQEQAYQEAIDGLHADLQEVENENIHLKKRLKREGLLYFHFRD